MEKSDVKCFLSIYTYTHPPTPSIRPFTYKAYKDCTSEHCSCSVTGWDGNIGSADGLKLPATGGMEAGVEDPGIERVYGF